ncbi:chemotaxis protein methyltransferase CheR [Thermoanaerobacter uzonensis DSM 18761]|uniref:protein-glutamate O-methyltransferase n=1 Tax=Thermoanaerobacter uzonensis DSM 18761 TaxID=1123369 RepID=A0A1M4V0W4_9THEO|nr:protein-glutamate O-methyltransferase CheR [Thermoanaerobacter uzonensis]SHE62569.1 chemotaxis protein methyltransferase CheR [Thermoanaerobacter uzonensis DSM 18761]
MVGYEDFVEKIHKLTGIDLSSYKEKQMKRRLESLITSHKFSSYEEYFNELTVNKTLYEEFLNYITINVTEFFRNPSQWEILEKDILPNIIKKGFRVWSAACSTGEEPYSVAMLLTKFIDLKDVTIIATDIDGRVLEKAKKGIYSAETVKKVPQEFLKKFLRKIDDKSYQISEDIRKSVQFEKHDLLKDEYPKNIDLLICRNVLIYFNDTAKDKIYKKFYESLNDSGIFFVGSTEQIILPYRYNFEPIKTFFYKKIIPQG